MVFPPPSRRMFNSMGPEAANAGFFLKKDAMFEQAVKNIDAVLRKEAGCASELDYAEQSSKRLFQKDLDQQQAVA